MNNSLCSATILLYGTTEFLLVNVKAGGQKKRILTFAYRKAVSEEIDTEISEDRTP